MRTSSIFLSAIACILFVWASISDLDAQINTPRPSPLSTVTQNVGLMEVSITYSRPGVKDRAIFGALVPYDKIWRTGANRSTKIKFSDDVVIQGKEVPAGEYSLFTIPGKTSWTVMINKNLKVGTGDYSQEEDVARFTVKPEKYPVKVETFTINVTDIRNDHAHIQLLWENTSVKFKLETEVDEKVMAEIEEKTAGVSQNTYYQAARYYYDTDRDMDKALNWINLALKQGEKFWMMRTKALIQAKMGDYKGAIASAERSTALATESGNEDYPRMNAESISEWKAMK